MQCIRMKGGIGAEAISIHLFWEAIGITCVVADYCNWERLLIVHAPSH